MVLVGIALMDVQHGRFGIEAEESQADDEGDRPHPDSLPESRLESPKP